MKMYFITAFCEGDCSNMDWFVLAHDAEEALDLYEEHMKARGFEDDYAIEGVFELPAISGEPRCLEWNNDEEVRKVG